MDKAIFIVGSSRSGTTMMGRILGAHPLIFTLHELHFFEQLWNASAAPEQISINKGSQLFADLLSIQREGYLSKRHPEQYYDEAVQAVTVLDADQLQPPKLFAAFLKYETTLEGKQIPCDQTPRNAFYIREIIDIFPEARIVAMVRDPRDVLLSQKRKWKRKFLGGKKIPLFESMRSWLNYHPLTIAKLWSGAIRSILVFKEHPHVKIIQFERLLDEPVETIQALCQFLGIAFDPIMLAVPQVGSSSGVDRPDRLGIAADRVGRWQHDGLNSAEIYLCQKVARNEMKIFGYKPMLVTLSPLILVNLLWFPFHFLGALFLNLGRMKNIRATIGKRLT